MKKVVRTYLFIFLTLAATGSISAQYYFFGRNKVQYEKLDWKIIRTEHFNIYYANEMTEIAEIGANFAEEAYKRLKVKFNHIVPRKIPLIFYNSHIQFQQTNVSPGLIPEGVGGFFEFMKGRVVIPYMGSIGNFKHVINHELVHVFMTNKIYFSIKDRRIPSGKYPPLWFIEGLAEYWSTEWDTQAEMIMRDVVLNNIFVPLSTMVKISGSFLMYKEGQNFLQFVSEEYGEERILMMIENLWRFGSFEEVIEYVLGEKIERIDEKWLFTLKRKYYTLMKNKSPHHIDAKQITNWGFNFAPNFYKGDSTDYVFFVANRNGYSSVYSMELDDDLQKLDDPTLIIEGENTPVFEAFHLMQPDMDVSDDGIAAFVTKTGRSDALHLFDIKNDDVLATYQFDEIITMNAPKFSHDGKKIVFNAKDEKGFSDIFILNLDDENIFRIFNDYYDDTNPVFSPDDKSIIFASDRTEGKYSGITNLFKYDLGTEKLQYLTYTDANCSMPDFSPEGSLYFISDWDGTNNLWKLEFNSNGLPAGMSQYTHFLTSVYDYDFVDSTRIITSAFEKFSIQLYSLDLASTPDSVKQFVEFDFGNIGDKWTPKKIVAESIKERLNYKKEYTLDYAVSQVATDPIYGTRGGALFTLSDILSDDRYFFLLYNTAETQNEFLKNFNVQITRLNSKYRTNFAYGVFHFSGRRYDIRESEEYFYERSFGGFFSLLYPFNYFQRLEITTTLANSDREIFLFLDSRKALLLSNSISFVHDNSLWGPTGPLDGSRLRVLLGYVTDIKYSNVNYYSFILDARKYFRLGYRTSLAARASIYVNEGKEARRYFAGGSWDLRGWPRWSIRGEKLWLGSLEFRTPLVDNLMIKLPFLGIGFSNIRGAAFFDAGNAWDDQYTETLGSIGVGIRWSFFGAMVFRYDIGKKIEKNFSQFQPKLFYQFFVGWDF